MENKRGPKMTVSEQWRRTAEARQRDVNALLDEFQTEIDVCNVRITDLFVLDHVAALNYANEVAAYMNERWEYHGHRFVVVGEWEQPIIQISENDIHHRHETASVFGSAKSNGFTVNTKDESKPPVIGHSFLTNSLSLTSPALRARLEPMAFASIDKVTLQYIRPAGNEVISADRQEILNALGCADNILYTYTNHPNSTFYQQTPKRQEQFLRDTLAIIEQALPVSETKDVAYVQSLQATFMYVQVGEKVFGTTPFNATHFKLEGRLLGVTIPDIMNDGYGRKYESPEELEASKAGICMIVEPERANFTLTPEMGSRVLVPLRDTDYMDMTVR